MNIAEVYQKYFWFVWYLVAINVIAFLIYGFDEAKANMAGARRVRERTLLVVALIGGSLGALFGMHIFRHKTQKLSFQAKLAVVLGLQIAIIWLIIAKG